MPRLFVLLVALLACARSVPGADVAPAPTIALSPKPWIRWWWPGSGVDEANITRQLEAFATAGLGGVEITPIYGAKGYEDRYVPYLSERWMQLLAHTGREAKRLGLGVDMATGTGWPFGGPWVKSADGSQKITLVDGQLVGTPTKMQVKRAAPGGEGLVLDPYSTTAITDYLAPFTAAFGSFPRELVRAQFHDSFEYYDASWSSELPKIFQGMHGYDLQTRAAELMGGTSAAAGLTGAGAQSPTSAAAQAPLDADGLRRLKSDYRATLAQMHLAYLQTWVRWSHDHGFLARNQSHGAPGNLLDLYGAVDVPETETFGSTPFPIPGLRRDPHDVRHDQDLPEPLVMKMASSAAHVMGHPLASSETCTWLREHWKVALAFTKPEIDRVFVEGINHVIYHGSCYSPEDAPWPGWLFYASTQFNPRNPWWDDFSALNGYVARVQTVLQGGQPDNDVLLYWPFYDAIDEPDGLMRQFTVHNVQWLTASACGKLARELTAQGFSYDYISDAQLAATHADAGGLVTPGGTHYRAIVIPATRRMPVETLSKLLTLQQGGGAVIYEAAPEDVPGLGQLDGRRAQFREINHAIAMSGCVIGNIAENLTRRGAVRESMVETGLSFIRRKTNAGDRAYFLANLTGAPVDRWIPLGTRATEATATNPLTGTQTAAALRSGSDGSTQIYLQLAPGESLLVGTGTTRAVPASRPVSGYMTPAGSPLPLSGEWSVTFLKGGPDLPPPFKTTELKSWTELGGDEAQRFAGTARYRIEFSQPAAIADDCLLDLGDVRESARVRLNGKELGTLWSLPFRVRVGDALRAGNNVLEIDVTNLAANRIRDLDRRGVPWKIMREINFVNINYRPFDASQWELTPSGLLGPVTLTPLRAFDPEKSAPSP